MRRGRAELLGLIALLATFAAPSSGQPCQTWVSINETLYSRTYVGFTDMDATTARPLGYKMSSYVFEGVRPCFTISPTNGNERHIEISYELQEAGGLCFRDKGTGAEQCSTSASNSECRTVPGGASSVDYEFYCQGGSCEAGEKLFWVRFVVEAPRADGSYYENWCLERNLELPSSLLQLPNNVSPPTDRPTTSSASVVRGRLVMLLTSFFLTTGALLLA